MPIMEAMASSRVGLVNASSKPMTSPSARAPLTLTLSLYAAAFLDFFNSSSMARFSDAIGAPGERGWAAPKWRIRTDANAQVIEDAPRQAVLDHLEADVLFTQRRPQRPFELTVQPFDAQYHCVADILEAAPQRIHFHLLDDFAHCTAIRCPLSLSFVSLVSFGSFEETQRTQATQRRR